MAWRVATANTTPATRTTTSSSIAPRMTIATAPPTSAATARPAATNRIVPRRVSATQPSAAATDTAASTSNNVTTFRTTSATSAATTPAAANNANHAAKRTTKRSRSVTARAPSFLASARLSKPTLASHIQPSGRRSITPSGRLERCLRGVGCRTQRPDGGFRPITTYRRHPPARTDHQPPEETTAQTSEPIDLLAVSQEPYRPPGSAPGVARRPSASIFLPLVAGILASGALQPDRRCPRLAVHRARSASRLKPLLWVVRGSRKARRKACGGGGRRRHRLGVLFLRRPARLALDGV